MWKRAAVGLLVVCTSVATSEARLLFADQVRDGVGGVDGIAGARGLAISPDGRHVYAVGAFDDAIAVFRRSTFTGALTFRQALRDGSGPVDGLDGPTQVVVSHDGRFVYVVSGEDAIAVFGRDPDSGELGFVTAYLGVGAAAGAARGVSDIAISPDDASVYAATDADTVIGFSRNDASGLLTVIDVEREGVDGVAGLTSIGSLALSPDGSRLYGLGFHTFVTFEREPSGHLHFLGRALAFAELAIGAGAVAVASNGLDVYATANAQGGALGRLRPDAAPGALSLIDALFSGSAVGGLGEPRDIALSADGAWIFVGGANTEIGAFRRLADGGFEFSEEEDRGLTSVFSLAVSPDSQYLYATGANSNSVVAFRIAADQGPVEIPALSPLGIAVAIAALAVALPILMRRRASIG